MFMDNIIARVVAEKLGTVGKKVPWGTLVEAEQSKFSSLLDWLDSDDGAAAIENGYVDLSVIDPTSDWKEHAVSELAFLASEIMVRSEDGSAMIRDPGTVNAMDLAGVSLDALGAAIKSELASDWGNAATDSAYANDDETSIALQQAASLAQTMRVKVVPVDGGWMVMSSPTIPEIMDMAGLGVDEEDVESLGEASKFYPFIRRKYLNRSHPKFGRANKRREVKRFKNCHCRNGRCTCTDSETGKPKKIDMWSYYNSGRKKAYAKAKAAYDAKMKKRADKKKSGEWSRGQAPGKGNKKPGIPVREK